MTDRRQAKAPGYYSEGHRNVQDTPILPMTAAECVREWAESVIFTPEYHAGRADGYRAGWDEAVHYYLEYHEWRKAFLDIATFGIDKAERLRREREQVAA